MISFPTGRNHHHSTPIISLHAHQKQQRKNVVCLHCVANCLHLCFSTGAASFTTGLDSGQEQRKKKKSILYSLSFLLVISWLGLLVSFIKLRWGGKCIFQQTNSSIASCTGFLCWLLPLLSCKWRKKKSLGSLKGNFSLSSTGFSSGHGSYAFPVSLINSWRTLYAMSGMRKTGEHGKGNSWAQAQTCTLQTKPEE